MLFQNCIFDLKFWALCIACVLREALLVIFWSVFFIFLNFFIIIFLIVSQSKPIIVFAYQSVVPNTVFNLNTCIFEVYITEKAFYSLVTIAVVALMTSAYFVLGIFSKLVLFYSSYVT